MSFAFGFYLGGVVLYMCIVAIGLQTEKMRFLPGLLMALTWPASLPIFAIVTYRKDV